MKVPRRRFLQLLGLGAASASAVARFAGAFAKPEPRYVAKEFPLTWLVPNEVPGHVVQKLARHTNLETFTTPAAHGVAWSWKHPTWLPADGAETYYLIDGRVVPAVRG